MPSDSTIVLVLSFIYFTILGIGALIGGIIYSLIWTLTQLLYMKIKPPGPPHDR